MVGAVAVTLTSRRACAARRGSCELGVSGAIGVVAGVACRARFAGSRHRRRRHTQHLQTSRKKSIINLMVKLCKSVTSGVFFDLILYLTSITFISSLNCSYLKTC